MKLQPILSANESNSTHRIYNRISIVLVGLSVAGVLAIIMAAAQNFHNSDTTDPTANWVAFIETIGIAILIGGAAFMSGGLAGLLFGIPKISEVNHTNANTSLPKVTQNDNLVQVSDWLTKILVGVTLTEIHNIPRVLQEFGAYMHESGVPTPKGYYPLIPAQAWVAIAIFYGVAGFSCAYLWTRIFFAKMLSISIRELEGPGDNVVVNPAPESTIH